MLSDKEWFHWFDRDEWTLAEAACLCHEVNPVDFGEIQGSLLDRVSKEIDLAIGAARSGALRVRGEGAQANEDSRVFPRDYFQWRRTKSSLRCLPLQLQRFCEKDLQEQERAAVPTPATITQQHEPPKEHGNVEVNATRREQMLGSALWCVHNYPQNCTKDGKLVAKWIAKQIDVHYEAMWSKVPERDKYTLMNEDWTRQLLSRWLTTRCLRPLGERDRAEQI